MFLRKVYKNLLTSDPRRIRTRLARDAWDRGHDSDLNNGKNPVLNVARRLEGKMHAAGRNLDVQSSPLM
jgi:hypothetical protein